MRRTDEEAPHALECGVVLPALAREDDAGLSPEALLLHALEHGERGRARDAELHHVQHALVVRPALSSVGWAEKVNREMIGACLARLRRTRHVPR